MRSTADGGTPPRVKRGVRNLGPPKFRITKHFQPGTAFIEVSAGFLGCLIRVVREFYLAIPGAASEFFFGPSRAILGASFIPERASALSALRAPVFTLLHMGDSPCSNGALTSTQIKKGPSLANQLLMGCLKAA